MKKCSPREPERHSGELQRKRRDFLKSTAAAGAAVTAPAVFSPAKAQARNETLLIVSESGPNNIDIHGVGTNVPGYEVSWNCYDRLISHGMKTLPNGTPYYDRDKIVPELAEDMSLGDMSVTFRLRRDATFHPQETAAPCWSAAMPTSPTSCQTRTSSS